MGLKLSLTRRRKDFFNSESVPAFDKSEKKKKKISSDKSHRFKRKNNADRTQKIKTNNSLFNLFARNFQFQNEYDDSEAGISFLFSSSATNSQISALGMELSQCSAAVTFT